MNIFDGINDDEFELLTKCLQAVKKTYKKDEIIFDIGDLVTSAAYILEGSVQLAKDDYTGNKIIINHLSKGDTFAEAMVFDGWEEGAVWAKAIGESCILFLNFEKIFSICSNSCRLHKKLISNIIKIISLKNLDLRERIELLSKKSLRERILYMLHKAKLNSKSSIFKIPFSREQMAEYICADRSALSRELSRMKREGLIDYHKNMFKFPKN